MTTVYIAAPLFSEAEKEFNRMLRDRLVEKGFTCFLPQEESNADHHAKHDTFTRNVQGIDSCNLMVAVLDGADADSGTAWEVGYAHARGIPVYGLRTDFRTLQPEGNVNLMIEEGVEKLCFSVDKLIEELTSDRF